MKNKNLHLSDFEKVIKEIKEMFKDISEVEVNTEVKIDYFCDNPYDFISDPDGLKECLDNCDGEDYEDCEHYLEIDTGDVDWPIGSAVRYYAEINVDDEICTIVNDYYQYLPEIEINSDGKLEYDSECDVKDMYYNAYGFIKGRLEYSFEDEGILGIKDFSMDNCSTLYLASDDEDVHLDKEGILKFLCKVDEDVAYKFAEIHKLDNKLEDFDCY
jgi:hypothetical protein